MIYRVIMDGNDIRNYQEKPYILINPSLSMELNTAGSFEFTMPPSHAMYDAVKPLASTIAVYEDETLLWFGRPVEIQIDFFKQKVVYCEGALAFFNDSVQRPHEYYSISIHVFLSTAPFPLTASFSPFPALNAGTFFAATSTVSPVRGLRAVVACLSLTSKLPNPGIVMDSPEDRVSVRMVMAVSMMGLISLSFLRVRLPMALMNSVLFMGVIRLLVLHRPCSLR